MLTNLRTPLRLNLRRGLPFELCPRCHRDLETLFARAASSTSTTAISRQWPSRRVQGSRRWRNPRPIQHRFYASNNNLPTEGEDAVVEQRELRIQRETAEVGEEEAGVREDHEDLERGRRDDIHELEENDEDGRPSSFEIEERRTGIYAGQEPTEEDKLVLAELWERMRSPAAEHLSSQGLDLGAILEWFEGVIRRERETARVEGGDRNMVEEKVLFARQVFGHGLPDGLLDEGEMEVFVRLYGEPEPFRVLREEEAEEIDEVDERQLVGEEGEEERGEIDGIDSEDFLPPSASLEQLPPQPPKFMEVDGTPVSEPRFHPLTLEGKFGTFPSAVSLPLAEVIEPVNQIFSNYSNKHITETAHRVFGGLGLPLSVSTPQANLLKQHRNKPLGLEASQSTMGEMEANAYLAGLMPGTYASIMSILVEVRKRLGSEWLERLIRQPGGPNVLDAGGGGAGILAWREVLKAEWARMHPDTNMPAPMGRSTVLTGSTTLRRRASALLENTTLIPRLPDYVHVRDKETLDDSRPVPQRKRFDLIIAPYTLAQLDEDYMRKQQVQNLWSLLNPEGGVLILLEKGAPRGFEVIAGARDHILHRFISSPESPQAGDLIQSTEDDRFTMQGPGMIIAPCTNHGKCPMYLQPGHRHGREDFCHFQQRFVRPSYLQRILGAVSKNFEDIKFSYIAARRGVDQRRSSGLVQGDRATDAAFASHEELAAISEDSTDFNALSLPRLILPALKRKGHVIMDVCTPSGHIERWTVPRSYSKQAFHDARKAQWGDLWALGAKNRRSRSVRTGAPMDPVKARNQRGIGYNLKKGKGRVPEAEDVHVNEDGTFQLRKPLKKKTQRGRKANINRNRDRRLVEDME